MVNESHPINNSVRSHIHTSAPAIIPHHRLRMVPASWQCPSDLDRIPARRDEVCRQLDPRPWRCPICSCLLPAREYLNAPRAAAVVEMLGLLGATAEAVASYLHDVQLVFLGRASRADADRAPHPSRCAMPCADSQPSSQPASQSQPLDQCGDTVKTSWRHRG